MVTGCLPRWAENDPSESGVPPEQLGTRVADICHRASFDGRCMAVAQDSGPVRKAVVPAVSIDCNPHDDGPGPRIPVANAQIVDDFWFRGLHPDAVVEAASTLRTQADRLEDAVLPALIDAREDWAVDGMPRNRMARQPTGVGE
ncbi:DUF6907 domain-containing protein [Streptomyces sp. DT24]|uniref:DUF6907 domain-containing protein n=1 Tax=Streptomyces sp. DT24 TaxID=3416520 RepID=UPI003CEC5316